MKVLVITLIAVLLIGTVESLGARKHEGKVSHQTQKDMHDQAQEAIVAVAS